MNAAARSVLTVPCHDVAVGVLADATGVVWLSASMFTDSPCFPFSDLVCCFFNLSSSYSLKSEDFSSILDIFKLNMVWRENGGLVAMTTVLQATAKWRVLLVSVCCKASRTNTHRKTARISCLNPLHRFRWSAGFQGTSLAFADDHTLVYGSGNTLTFISRDGSHVRSAPSLGKGIGRISVCVQAGLMAYSEVTLDPKIFVLSYPDLRLVSTLEGEPALPSE